MEHTFARAFSIFLALFVICNVNIVAECLTPPATVTASAVYNSGDALWSNVFADDHRSASLSSTSTSEPYYQWILCNADGSYITDSPTVDVNHLEFLSLSTGNTATVQFDLPGTYYFVLRAGCSKAVYTSSNVVRVDVPYPEMGVSGNLLNGTYGCDQTGIGKMERRGLTWSINFNVYYPGDYPSWNKDFAVFQRYKLENTEQCGGTSGTEGWDVRDYDGWTWWQRSNKIGYAANQELINITRDAATYHENIEGLQNGDNVTLTVTMTGYDSYKVVLLKNCTPPGAVEASILYNDGVEPWVGTFADGHRSALLRTSATQYPYYQWFLCDDSGNEITSTPTDAANNVHFVGDNSSYNAIVQFNLPGSYNFRVKVGCDDMHYTLSSIVHIDVPAPVFGVSGPLFYGSWGCQAPFDGLLGRETPTGLIWSKVFDVTGLNTEAWSNDFAVFQRYKRGDTGLCYGTAGTYGWNIYDDYNTANKTGYAEHEETINCTKKTKNDGNYVQTVSGLNNGSKVQVIVEMKGYDSYKVELRVICIAPDAPPIKW